MGTCKSVGQPIKMEQLTTVSGKVSDVWPEDIVRSMGEIAIAFAQLEHACIVVAKRFDKEIRVLLDFALLEENRNNSFDQWCKVLKKSFHDYPEWRAAAETAQCLGRERNSLFHGNWSKDKATGERCVLHLPKAGDARLIPLEPVYFGGMVKRIRSTRNKLLKARP